MLKKENKKYKPKIFVKNCGVNGGKRLKNSYMIIMVQELI